MKIKIDALDTLFFRDGKPFTLGAETWADTLFPPSPSVIYGALRGKYFAEHIAELKDANEPDDPTKGLRIQTIALQSGNRLLFNLPLDYVHQKGGEEKHVFLLKNTPTTPVSNCPVKNIVLSEKEMTVENVENGLFHSGFLRKYLHGQLERFHCEKLSDYLVSEPKIGIARQNQTHSSQEGMLYRVDMHRLESKMAFEEPTQSISLFVEFDGLSIPSEGFLKLGGESKSAYYTESNATTMNPPQLSGNRFKLYLASPAMFEQGWLPEWIDPNTLEGTRGELNFRLETAILGKPIVIGGFDMKKKEPKIMRKAVPAGSVYYFRIIEGTAQDAVDIFHHQNISDYEASQGFGLAFVGGAA